MTITKLSDRYDLNDLHAKVEELAQGRERRASLGLARTARIAAAAFRESKREGTSFEEAQTRAFAALEQASTDSGYMIDNTLRALDDAEAVSQVRKREFAYEFLFAAAVPALAAVFVVWLAMSHSELIAKSVFGVVVAAFVAGTVVALREAVKGSRVARLKTWSAVLVHSGGSLAAGLCVFVVAGYVAHGYGEKQFSIEREARLERVNQTAALTLAAIQANASTERLQAAVSQSGSAADWLHVESGPRSEGAVLARATLPRTQTAELRLASASETSPRLAAFLTSKSGVEVPYIDYVVGTVVKADLDKVTISTGQPAVEKIYKLPAGTLPPPLKSDVVAAVARTDQSVVFIQSIDAAVAELRR